METEQKGVHQITYSGDGKTKQMFSFKITKGNVHDSKKFVPLVRGAFERCSGIEKVRTGCQIKTEEVMIIRKLIYQGWNELQRCG